MIVELYNLKLMIVELISVRFFRMFKSVPGTINICCTVVTVVEVNV